jgi:hypothetical protein
MPASICLNCGASEQERPLLKLQFQGQEVYICPQCMPILIHKPHQLADKLPGFNPPTHLPSHDQ